MTTKTIPVQMTDSKWTRSAVETACRMAREYGGAAEIAPVRMLPQDSLNWRGLTAFRRPAAPPRAAGSPR